MLNYRIWDIVKEVKALKLAFGEYVVVGSGPLAIRGIRPAHDIDLMVTQKVYNTFKRLGWKEEHFPETERPWVLFHGSFDISTSWSVNDYRPTFEQLLKSADSIEGVPFANLKDVLQWKKTCGRDKDLKDVALIETYLKNK